MPLPHPRRARIASCAAANAGAFTRALSPRLPGARRPWRDAVPRPPGAGRAGRIGACAVPSPTPLATPCMPWPAWR